MRGAVAAHDAHGVAAHGQRRARREDRVERDLAPARPFAEHAERARAPIRELERRFVVARDGQADRDRRRRIGRTVHAPPVPRAEGARDDGELARAADDVDAGERVGRGRDVARRLAVLVLQRAHHRRHRVDRSRRRAGRMPRRNPRRRPPLRPRAFDERLRARARGRS